MPDRTTFQIHANVNADHGDSALRVTMTSYDAGGHQIATTTWRKHIRTLDFDGDVWQAYSAMVELARMMAHYAHAEMPVDLDAEDQPLF